MTHRTTVPHDNCTYPGTYTYAYYSRYNIYFEVHDCATTNVNALEYAAKSIVQHVLNFSTLSTCMIPVPLSLVSDAELVLFIIDLVVPLVVYGCSFLLYRSRITFRYFLYVINMLGGTKFSTRAAVAKFELHVHMHVQYM